MGLSHWHELQSAKFKIQNSKFKVPHSSKPAQVSDAAETHNTPADAAGRDDKIIFTAARVRHERQTALTSS